MILSFIAFLGVCLIAMSFLFNTPRDILRMIAADEDIWKTLVPAEAHRSALHFR